jgi:hypothetical protein
MRVIDPGHHYELDVFDGDATGYRSLLRFMKRVGHGYPHNTEPTYPGTNCQEVIRALIDRVKYLHMQIPHPKNGAILDGLRAALVAFEERAAERHGRELVLTKTIEHEISCQACGHIGCIHLEYWGRFERCIVGTRDAVGDVPGAENSTPRSP